MAEIIDRTPAGLLDALCGRIKKALNSCWYEAEQFESGDNEDYHDPCVHAQYLPVSKTELEERDKSKDCPVVRVVVTTGVISDFSESSNGSEINIKIYFCGYSNEADRQGWRIPMAMLWRVLQDLLSDTIINGYQLKTPVKWSPLPDENKEPPYYTAVIETAWQGDPPTHEIPVGIVDLPGKESTEKFPAAENQGKPQSVEG